MLAKPTMMSFLAVFFIVSFFVLSSAAYAEPIGSIKSLKSLNNTSVKQAPNPDNNNNLSSNVARSQFTTAVVNREPTDNVVMLTSNSSEIYYFTELSDLKGHNIRHRWQYQGKVMAEIKFDVKSDRWRVYSSKKIRPDWTGEWSVELIDENGKSLLVNKLKVVATNTN